MQIYNTILFKNLRSIITRIFTANESDLHFQNPPNIKISTTITNIRIKYLNL